MRIGGRIGGLGLAIILLGATGCVSFGGNRLVAADEAAEAERDAFARATRDAVVIYVDGAGGGGPITDATPEIRRGLEQAGFAGVFEPFRWQTGLGALVDQTTSAAYKRDRGVRLAEQIRRHWDDRPHRPIHLIASSAGTAIAAFALEVLGDGREVESVVLMSSAMRSDYDLSGALRHVRGRMFVLTSDRDGLLKLVVPLVGGADRGGSDAAAAGLVGFAPSADADDATRQLYAKVEMVPWREEFAALGHGGGHTDGKSSAFIREVVAPLALAGRQQQFASK